MVKERLWHNIRESLWTLRVQRQRGTQRERYNEAVLHSFNTCFAMAPLSVLRTLWGWAVVGHLSSYWQGKVPGMALSWMLSSSLLVRHSRVCHQGTGKPMRQNNYCPLNSRSPCPRTRLGPSTAISHTTNMTVVRRSVCLLTWSPYRVVWMSLLKHFDYCIYSGSK